MLHNKSQMVEAVIRLASESESFKQRLLAEPKEALREFGFDIPYNMEISVHQEHKNKMVLVVPENPLGNLNNIIAGSIPPTKQGTMDTMNGCSTRVGVCHPSEPSKRSPEKPFSPKPKTKPDTQPESPPAKRSFKDLAKNGSNTSTTNNLALLQNINND